MLTPVLYKNAPNRREIQNLYFTAFPKYEQMPWWLLRLLTIPRGAALTGYYDNDTFCGFTYTAATEQMLFVMFFAVQQEIRGKGYGSAVLELLKQNNPGKTILLNVELLDENAPNYAQRVQRFRFYEKNGFYDTGLNIDEVGGTFRVLASCREIDPKAYQRVFQNLSCGLWKPKIRKAE